MLRERVERGMVRLGTALPPTVVRLLAGKPVQVDGLTLEPDVQLGLRMLAAAGGRALDQLTVAEARVEMGRSARLFAGFAPAVARVEDLALDQTGLRARWYVPKADGAPRPLVVFYHGGGWVVGDLETHDGLCRFLAVEGDVAVLAIDYRLAPEHPFPAAVDDAVTGFRWAVAHADRLGTLPARIAVAGDSAGGNLAAVVTQMTTRDGGPKPAAQALIYPVTDLSTHHASYTTFAEGFFLTRAAMDWYRDHYLRDPSHRTDPRASPLLTTDIRGLPPAVVLTAGFDVLRDEGEAYAARMQAAGVEVVTHRAPGLIHGFANTTGSSPASRTAMLRAVGALRGWLA